MTHHKKVFLFVFLCFIIFMTSVAEEKPATNISRINSYQDILPANTLAVFSIADTSELKALLEGPEIRSIISEFGFKEMFDEQLADAESKIKAKTGLELKELYDSLSGDITVALIDLQMDGGNPNIAFLVGVEGGATKVPTLLNGIKEAAEQEDEPIEMKRINGTDVFMIAESAYAFEQESHLVITSKISSAESILKDGPKLKDNETFAIHSTMAGLDSGFVVYANVKPLVEMLKSFVQSNEDEDPATSIALKVFDLFALEKIDSCSMSFPYYYDGKFKLFIYAPGYDGIINKFLSTTPVDKTVEAVIPNDNDVVALYSIREPVIMFDAFVDMMKQLAPPEENEKFHAGIEMMQQNLNLDIRNELLAAFGTLAALTIRLDIDSEINMLANPFAIFKSLGMEVLLSVKNADMLKSAFDKIVVISEGNLVHETMSNADIYSVWPENQGFPATLALSNGFLRFGLYDADTMKANLSVVQSGKSMNTNQEYLRRTSNITNACMLSYTSPSYIRKWIDFYFKIMNEMESDESGSKPVQHEAAYDKSWVWFSRAVNKGYYVEGDFYPKDFINIFKFAFMGTMSQLADFDQP